MDLEKGQRVLDLHILPISEILEYLLIYVLISLTVILMSQSISYDRFHPSHPLNYLCTWLVDIVAIYVVMHDADFMIEVDLLTSKNKALQILHHVAS